MAITTVTYSAVRAASRAGALPRAAAILEFGEANWYGDVPPQMLRADIDFSVPDGTERTFLKRALDEIIADCGTDPADVQRRSFGLAKIFYRIFFGCRETVAIDLDGTDASLKLDLNHPVDLGRQFPVTINNGTAEHVFNLGQFFATMHRCTAPGGVMIHEGPLINGWVDHGFVNFQPTLFFDMAAANRYEIEAFYVAQIAPFEIRGIGSREEMLELAAKEMLPKNPVFFVMLRKAAAEANFAFPIQGVYARSLSPRAQEAWKTWKTVR